MTDAASDKILSITVWESEVDMLAGESSGGYYSEQIGKFASVFDGPSSLEHYELSVEASP